MPRHHRRETYTQGQLVETSEVPYTAEEETAADEAEEKGTLLARAETALSRWASLTAGQKDTVLRELLRFAILLYRSR